MTTCSGLNPRDARITERGNDAAVKSTERQKYKKVRKRTQKARVFRAKINFGEIRRKCRVKMVGEKSGELGGK